jgi:hypothetical protein
LLDFLSVSEVLWALDVFSTKLSAKGKAPGKAGTRFWKNVGLGFKTPREAIEGKIEVWGFILWAAVLVPLVEGFSMSHRSIPTLFSSRECKQFFSTVPLRAA